MWRCVDHGLTDVSEERIVNTMKIEAMRSSEISVKPGSTQRHIPEDDIIHVWYYIMDSFAFLQNFLLFFSNSALRLSNCSISQKYLVLITATENEDMTLFYE
jgi:hypothetical protein